MPKSEVPFHLPTRRAVRKPKRRPLRIFEFRRVKRGEMIIDLKITANISPISVKMSFDNLSSSNYKLIKSIDTMELPKDLMTDDSCPAYAKTLITQLSSMLKAASSLLKAQPSFHDQLEEETRQKSIGIANMPESTQPKSTARAAEDMASALHLIDVCEVEITPISVYRMGTPPLPGDNSRPRLIKMVLPTRTHTMQILKRKKALLADPKLRVVRIRESLTLEQRIQYKNLVAECKSKRTETGLDFIIYANKIVESKLFVFRIKYRNTENLIY